MSAEKSASSYSGSAKSTPERLDSSTSGIEPVMLRGRCWPDAAAESDGRSLVMLNFAASLTARTAAGKGVPDFGCMNGGGGGVLRATGGRGAGTGAAAAAAG